VRATAIASSRFCGPSGCNAVAGPHRRGQHHGLARCQDALQEVRGLLQRIGACVMTTPQTSGRSRCQASAAASVCQIAKLMSLLSSWAI